MAATERRKLAARLEHRSPGRIRVRVPKSGGADGELDRVRRHLESHSAVTHVTVNRRSGSVLVEGESTTSLHGALEEVLDIIEHARADAADAGVDAAVALVKSVDARLMEATAGRLTLRWLVPAAFVSFGVRQLLAEGLTIGAVPWYVLIYYGVDSFMKLYPEHAPDGQPKLTVVHNQE